MENEQKSRRDFMGMALGAWAAIGGIGALYAAKRSWDPLPSVKSAGFVTFDLAGMEENTLVVEKWRGKPIFVLKKTKDMEPHDRDIVIGSDRFLVAIGLCTHLGCIPAYVGEEKKFKCACHGGEFTTSGVNLPDLPPPSPLEIPPFKLDGTKITLGQAGKEFNKLKEKNLIA